MLQTHRLSRKDYDSLPPGHPPREWHQGDVYEMTAAHGRHGLNLLYLIEALGRSGPDGQCTTYVDTRVDLPDASFFPDLALLKSDGAAKYDDQRGVIEGPPYLVVEILSDATAARDRVLKLQTYLEAGVQYCWIVDPRVGTIEEFVPGPTRTLAVDRTEEFLPRAFLDWTVPARNLLPSPPT